MKKQTAHFFRNGHVETVARTAFGYSRVYYGGGTGAAQTLGACQREAEQDGLQARFSETEAEARGYLLDAAAVASWILIGLSKKATIYARDPARGETRGFAALHDLMDANLLLPVASQFTDSAAHVAFCSDVIEEVTRLLIS